MSDDSCAFVCGFILAFLLTFLLSMIGWNEFYRASAIERGVARYHPVTGTWEWTVEVQKKAEKEK